MKKDRKNKSLIQKITTILFSFLLILTITVVRPSKNLAAKASQVNQASQAEQAAEDGSASAAGVSLEVKSDKAEYAADENIALEVAVKNSSKQALEHLSLAVELPQNFSSLGMSTTQNIKSISPNSDQIITWNLAYAAPALISEENLGDTPALANASVERSSLLTNNYVIIAAAVVVLIVLALAITKGVKKKKAKNTTTFSILLVLLLALAVAGNVPAENKQLYAKENQNYNQLTAVCALKVAGQQFDVKVNLNYQVTDNTDAAVALLMTQSPNRGGVEYRSTPTEEAEQVKANNSADTELTMPGQNRKSKDDKDAELTTLTSAAKASTSQKSSSSKGSEVSKKTERTSEQVSSQETSKAETSASKEYIVHIVEAGESMSSIADQYDIDLYTLAAYNNRPLTGLEIGEKILIPVHVSQEKLDELRESYVAAMTSASTTTEVTTQTSTTAEETSSETTVEKTSQTSTTASETTLAPETSASEKETSSTTTTEKVTTTTTTEATTTTTTTTKATTAATTTTAAPTTTDNAADSGDGFVYIDGLAPMTAKEYGRYQIIQNWYANNNVLIGNCPVSGSTTYAYGWCTDYAYRARYVLGEATGWKWLGNASTWGTYINTNVYPLHYEPMVGSVGWTRNSNHVFFVEKVHNDGTITYSEGGYNYGPNQRQTRASLSYLRAIYPDLMFID